MTGQFSANITSNLRKSRVQSWEIIALTTFPIFVASNKAFFCAIFSLYFFSKILTNRQLLINRTMGHPKLSLSLLALVLYLLTKGKFDGYSLNHALSDSTFYPVTYIDYILLLTMPLVISFLPITTVEIFSLAISFALVTIMHLFIGLYFEGGFSLLDLGFWPPLFKIPPGWLGQSRLTSGFTNPNILAFFAVSGAIVSFSLIKAALTILKTHASDNLYKLPFFGLLFVGVAGLASGAALAILSGSRAPVGLLLLCTTAAAVIYGSRLILGILITCVGFLTLQITGTLQKSGISLPGLTFGRLNAMVENFQTTDAERIKIFSCFWNESLRNPLIGQGISQSTKNCEELAQYPAYGFNHGHNLFLHALSEIGFPATFAILSLVFGLFYRGFKMIKNERGRDTPAADLRVGFFAAAVSGLGLSMTSLAMFHWYPLLIMFSFFLGSSCASEDL
jgi:O-antigen ligase